MTTCMMTYPPARCTLPVGHDGPHATRDGHGWHDYDDMGVGVTAALIEKEAEESPSVDYETMWWDAERRAEKAEAERDRWHSMWRQRGIKHLAAEKRATRAKAQADIRGCAVVVYRERAREAEQRERQGEATIRRQERYIEDLESVDVVGLKARAQRAEARVEAVEDVLDTYEEENINTPHRHPTPHGDGLGPTLVDADDIRHALDGDPMPPHSNTQEAASAQRH